MKTSSGLKTTIVSTRKKPTGDGPASMAPATTGAVSAIAIQDSGPASS